MASGPLEGSLSCQEDCVRAIVVSPRAIPKNKLESLGARKVILRPIDELRPSQVIPDSTPQRSLRALAQYASFWDHAPLLIDESGTILAGHGRLEAAKQIGFQEVVTQTDPFSRERQFKNRPREQNG